MTSPIWFAERPVGEMRPGDHAWLPYADGEQRDRIIGDFVHDGLCTNEKVVYLADCMPWQLPSMMNNTDLTRYVQTGQLRLLPRREACLTPDGEFDPDRLMRTLGGEIGRALDESFRACRVTLDLSWALREPGGRRLLMGCEGDFERTIAPSTMTMAICQVHKRACSPEELAALREHHEVMVDVNPDFQDNVLKIVRTYDPYGLRIEGELDAARNLVFVEALANLRVQEPEVHLDLSKLDFISLDALNTLAAYSMRRARPTGLILDHLPADVEQIIDMVGWQRLPGVRRGILL